MSRIPRIQKLAAGQSTPAFSNVLAIDIGGDGAVGALVTIAGSDYTSTGAGRIIDSLVPLQQVILTAPAGNDVEYRVWMGKDQASRPFVLTPAIPVRAVTGNGAAVSTTNPGPVMIADGSGSGAMALVQTDSVAVALRRIGSGGAILETDLLTAMEAAPALTAPAVIPQGRDSTGQGRPAGCDARTPSSRYQRRYSVQLALVAAAAPAIAESVDTTDCERVTALYTVDNTGGAGFNLTLNMEMSDGTQELLSSTAIGAGAVTAVTFNIGPGIDPALAFPTGTQVNLAMNIPDTLIFGTSAAAQVSHSLVVDGR